MTPQCAPPSFPPRVNVEPLLPGRLFPNKLHAAVQNDEVKLLVKILSSLSLWFVCSSSPKLAPVWRVVAGRPPAISGGLRLAQRARDLTPTIFPFGADPRHGL